LFGCCEEKVRRERYNRFVVLSRIRNVRKRGERKVRRKKMFFIGQHYPHYFSVKHISKKKKGGIFVSNAGKFLNLIVHIKERHVPLQILE